MPTFTAVPAPSGKEQTAKTLYGIRFGWMRPFVDMREAPVWRVVLTTALASFAVNLLFLTLGAFGSQRYEGIWFGFSIAFAMWLSMGYLNSWLTRQVDWLHQPWRAFAITLALNVVVAVSALGLVYFTKFVVLGGEDALQWLLRQRFNYYIGSVLIGLLISAIFQGAVFLRIWKASLLEAEQLKTATVSAKYAALNAQINPHFLFNSLNVLSALVKQDPDRAEDFIQGLSQVYRYVLEVKGEQLVPLEKELAAAHAYAELVAMRFGESRLHIDFDLQAHPNEQVVPLALQMLLENAVKHNGATRRNPLHIRLTRQGEEIVVHNNRVPLFEPAESKGIGLANIRERYRLASDAEVGVMDGEETFEVRLPVV